MDSKRKIWEECKAEHTKLTYSSSPPKQTNLPNSSRYILTFSSAKICREWWGLVQSEFGGLPSNTRESAQLFSFSGDDMPGRAWKNPRFEKLKTKWFYTQLGDAVGTAGRGMEVLPLQDEKGWIIDVAPSANESVAAEENVVQRRPSSVESLTEMKGRRWSKRDSGILLMSPFSEHFKNAEEANKVQQIPEDNGRTFDFERMEKNLEKMEKMMEQNVLQMRSLEHIQAANLERLTAALLHNVEMVQELARGQEGLVHACEELRTVVDKRDEAARTRLLEAEETERERKISERKAERERQMSEENTQRERKMSEETAERERRLLEEKTDRERQLIAERAEKDRQIIADKAEKGRRKTLEKDEKERKLTADKAERERKTLAAVLERLERRLISDQEERDKRSRSKEEEGRHLACSQSIMSTATDDTSIATLSPCGHVVRRAPRKLGRQVVGYIYADDEHEDVGPVQRDKRRTERG